MEKFRRAYENFKRAFRRFEEVRSQSLLSFFSEDFYTEIVVKRFEYTYEAMWKAVQEFLRNRLVHVYDEKTARELRDRILEEDIHRLFKEVLDAIITP